MPLIVGIELSVELPSRHTDTSVSRGAYAFILLSQIDDWKGMRFQNSLEFFAVRRAIVYDNHLVIRKRLSANRIQSLTHVTRCVVDRDHHAYRWCLVLRVHLRSRNSHLHGGSTLPQGHGRGTEGNVLTGNADSILLPRLRREVLNES